MSVRDMLPNEISPESFQDWAQQVSDEIDGIGPGEPGPPGPPGPPGIGRRLVAEVDTLDPLRVWIDEVAVDAVNISNRPIQSGDLVHVDASEGQAYIVASQTRRGWEPLPYGHATASGAMNIPVPTERYSMLRVYGVGQLSDAGLVTLRLNQSIPESGYRASYNVIQMNTGDVIEAENQNTHWVVGQWSNSIRNHFHAVISGMEHDVESTIEGIGVRLGTGAASRHTNFSGFTSGHSIEIDRIRLEATGASIAQMEVWVEGWAK